MAHTADSIQAWIDGYTFIDNAKASKDILQQIIKNLDGHSYTFGPTEAGGYTLKVSGPIVDQTFIIKADS